eukprot:jgi/Chlat1/6786/Chrsp51S06558
MALAAATLSTSTTFRTLSLPSSSSSSLHRRRNSAAPAAALLASRKFVLNRGGRMAQPQQLQQRVGNSNPLRQNDNTKQAVDNAKDSVKKVTRAALNSTTIRTLAIAVAIPNVLGVLVSLICAPDIAGRWYRKDLDKPAWTPPAPLFGFAWSVIYTGMGVASWLVWSIAGGLPAANGPLKLYAINLVLNLLWQPLFFRAKALGVAFVDLLLLLGAVVATGRAFGRVSKPAGLFFLGPYLLWVAFAGVLNWSIWRRNVDNPAAYPAAAS